MRNVDAITNKGAKVRVTGYNPPRVGTIVGFEWIGRYGKKAMYVNVDFGKPMPNWDSGVIPYKAKYLKFVKP